MQSRRSKIKYLETEIYKKEQLVKEKRERYIETEPIVLIEKHREENKKISRKQFGVGFIATITILCLINLLTYSLGFPSHILMGFLKGLLSGVLGFATTSVIYGEQRKELNDILTKEINEHFDEMKDILVLNSEIKKLKQEVLHNKTMEVLNMPEKETKLLPAVIERLQSQKQLQEKQDVTSEEVVDNVLNID